MLSISGVLRPKEPRNLAFAGVACGLLLAGFLIASRLAPWSPKRGLGLVLGILAALAYVFEMLYPLRRSRARPFGTAKAWLQFHVYLGTCAMLAVALHAGGLPSGTMGWSLLLLSLWTTATGLLGVLLQKWIPAAIAEGLRVEALYERIPELVEKLAGEADEIAKGAGEVLERFYLGEVRSRLTGLEPGWAYLFDVRAGRDRQLEPFRRMGEFVDEDDRGRLEDLSVVFTEKLELDAHHRLQGVLRAWLLLHVPPAALLMGLLLVHVFAWLWY
jgi:hypothetical protein